MSLVNDNQDREIAVDSVPSVPVVRMQTNYATAVAVQRPRDLSTVRSRFLEEARLAGESFYYGWSAGGERIEGPSIKCAMAVARCWGNCAVEAMPVQDCGDSWVFTSAFVDLETGCTITRQFRQSKKSVVAGKHDRERKDDIRFQIGQSKAARNVVLNALPEWLVAQAVEEAKLGVRAKIEKYIASNGIVAAVDLALKQFAKVGVAEEHVLAKCGVAGRGAITTDHLVMLRGDLTAIQDGQERAATLFPTISPAPEATSKVSRSPLTDQLSTAQNEQFAAASGPMFDSRQFLEAAAKHISAAATTTDLESWAIEHEEQLLRLSSEDSDWINGVYNERCKKLTASTAKPGKAKQGRLIEEGQGESYHGAGM